MRTSDISGRREFLKLLAAAGASAVTAASPAFARGAPAPTGLKFFTGAEFATLDEIAEMIVPADERSGGARAARVAEMIDGRLAESLDPLWRKSWKEDLAEIDRLSRLQFRRLFVEATLEQRTALLDLVSRNEAAPKEAGEYAFGTIKWTVTETYYRTRIGIHDEIGYKGNVIQDEFSGIDVSRG